MGAVSLPLRHVAPAVLAMVALVPAAGETSSFTTFITTADEDSSALATRRMNEYCSSVNLGDIDRTSGRKGLEAAVGDENILLDSLKEAKNPEETGEIFQEKVTAMWILGTAGPIVCSLLLVILWLFCCWSACPCCKCCRCCAKQRKRSRGLKALVLLVVILLLTGMAISAFVASTGRGYMEDGVDSITCTSARVLEKTLNGDPGNDFIGMLPMLDQFGEMREILGDSSPFVDEVFKILNNTGEIKQATYLAQQSLQLLKDTLQLAANMNPPAPTAGDTTGQFHKCLLCETLTVGDTALLTLAQQGLDAGLATALAGVNAEVQTQLGPESRTKLRASFDSGVDPLLDAKNMVRDTTKFFLTDDFRETQDFLLEIGQFAVLSISIFVFLVGGCACSAGVMCNVNEYNMHREGNPWNRSIAPCACTGWCCGWLYAIFVFFLGGIMVSVNVVVSSTCLPMEDLDSALMEDIMPALGTKMTGDDQYVMVKDMVDVCFSQQVVITNKTLMDIMFVRENETKVTLRQKIQSQTTDLITQKFANVESLLDTSVNLMTDEQVLLLLSTLSDTPIDAVIVAQQPALTGDADYQGLVADPNGIADPTAGVQVGLASSLACDDFSYSGVTPAVTIVGLSTLLTKMLVFDADDTKDATSPAHDCTGRVGCDEACAPADIFACAAACAAANKLMDLKAELLGLNTYRCDVFQFENGDDCDVKDMASSGDGYTNECLITGSDGSLSVTPKQKTCTLPEFKQYVQDWSTRLTKVFTRVDTAVPAVQSAIVTDLQNLVQSNVTGPVNNIVDKGSCSFLKQVYADMITGLCYQGARGFRWVALSYSWNGVLSSLLVLLGYIIWRHSVDNRNKWFEDMEAGKTDASAGLSQVVPAPGGGSDEERVGGEVNPGGELDPAEKVEDVTGDEPSDVEAEQKGNGGP